MQELRVAERRQTYTAIQWDGSAAAADWVTAHFGEQAALSGDGDEQTLTMWGTWEIPLGDYLIDRSGAFHYVPAGQINDEFERAADPVVEVD